MPQGVVAQAASNESDEADGHVSLQEEHSRVATTKTKHGVQWLVVVS